MRTANPALSDKVFQGYTTATEKMTLSGTVNKSLILIFIVFMAGAFTWDLVFPEGQNALPLIPIWLYATIFGALIVAVILVLKKELAPYLAPAYAILEGCALGIISAFFEITYPGIVVDAITGTVGVFVALLLVYKSGFIKVTENFKLGVVAATGGIFLIYLVDIVMGFFGNSISFIHEGSLIGIGFSVIVIIIAALNLVLDFDFIERGVERGAPKFMEWYAAFGLLVTIVWLYIEMLRLLAKTRSR
ncbi:putative YccA/Bax inhibitor family protein [Methanohalophilus levihalophilus]|uniref:Bax inhibitor-1/YccA family protein n=1 Tax=Methanohalophilus levihalophilus TaxID=1431282 RepID=UPI001AE820AF|nr:Bax inhibitor-1/YccA family protein [Methanohalophilus levihalophilus]MBP2029886.1 putative YccA/Bax inhibitor family protein [Methanohalophilus levihalophilus]